MANVKTPPSNKKNHRALRRLVGTVVIAGATYAIEKIIENRKKKRTSKKKSI